MDFLLVETFINAHCSKVLFSCIIYFPNHINKCTIKFRLGRLFSITTWYQSKCSTRKSQNPTIPTTSQYDRLLNSHLIISISHILFQSKGSLFLLYFTLSTSLSPFLLLNLVLRKHKGVTVALHYQRKKKNSLFLFQFMFHFLFDTMIDIEGLPLSYMVVPAVPNLLMVTDSQRLLVVHHCRKTNGTVDSY